MNEVIAKQVVNNERRAWLTFRPSDCTYRLNSISEFHNPTQEGSIVKDKDKALELLKKEYERLKRL